MGIPLTAVKSGHGQLKLGKTHTATDSLAV